MDFDNSLLKFAKCHPERSRGIPSLVSAERSVNLQDRRSRALNIGAGGSINHRKKKMNTSTVAVIVAAAASSCPCLGHGCHASVMEGRGYCGRCGGPGRFRREMEEAERENREAPTVLRGAAAVRRARFSRRAA